MPKPIKVSVITITYNHEKFIKQTLESIVKQKTTFDFELIVADDHSTDGTQGIIREYAKKYPNVVRPLLREKNVGAQNNFKDAIEKACGEYIALCEGDDYWCDEGKLQKQVDYLESNPDNSLVFHPVSIVYQDESIPRTVYPVIGSRNNFNIEKLLKTNFIQTNSVLYRKQDYANLPTDILPLDWYLHLYHAQHGKIGFINEVMSVYRRHESGIWWRSSRSSDFWKKNAVLHINLFKEIIKLFPGRVDYKKLLQQNIFNIVNEVVEADIENHTTLLEMLHEHYPEDIQQYVIDRYMDDMNLRQQHKSDTALIKRLNDEASSREKMIIELREHIKDTQRQLDDIQNSRVWKTRNSVASVVRKRRIK